MCLARVVKKFEFFRPRLKETPHFGAPKFCQILPFLYIYVLNFMTRQSPTSDLHVVSGGNSGNTG